ncbi:MAG: RluA family pseudouridine synthase [Bacteroides sp.]|nr:RluA family pseudouridine synthase [Prevotella sp.]MCM1406855.1 RluA family pseudouridine synthase [Treponema brennaborense]MCM1470816.1 RluA family pseudouridine synthase [Bacteroides sp.]
MNCIPIVYSDSEIVIIRKPAGLAVQGGSGITHSVDTLLAAQLGIPIYLVHRLDKDTSGLLVAAKSPQAASKWTRIIGSKKAQKEYRALCIGVPRQKSGIITAPVTQHGTEKHAETRFRVLETYQTKPPLSLVALKIGTGRMHQIRIHLAQLGLPIAGDDKYGDFKSNREIKKIYGIKRLQLAAVKLSVPLAGKTQVFEVPDNFETPPKSVQSAPEQPAEADIAVYSEREASPPPRRKPIVNQKKI